MPKKSPQKPKAKKKQPKPTEAEVLRTQETETEKRFKHFGRPSIFTQALADKICTLLMQGRSLRSICREEAMPNVDTIFQWLIDKRDFSDQYTRARQVQADLFFEEALQIAHDGTNDYEEVEENGKTKTVVNYDHIQRSKLRVDTLKWAVGKMAPKKYGDRSAVEVSGPEGGPAQVQIVLPSNGREKMNAEKE